MGKGSRSSKMYGKVVSKDHSERPGWKGPGFQKPKEKPKARPVPVSKTEEEEDDIVESLIPVELQQLLLNIFKDVFEQTLKGNDLLQSLQDVKTALYERDFEKAFGREDWREVYAVRWSPSRALCYQSMLVDIQEFLDELHPTEKTTPLNVACFGGGAAEVVAFGGFIKYLRDASASSSSTTVEPPQPVEPSNEEEITTLTDTLQTTTLTPTSTPELTINLALFDIASWTTVVQNLQTGLLTPPTISKYASAAVKAANRPPLLTPTDLATTFQTTDVFSLSLAQLTTSFGKEPMLLTLLFTLNELYSVSISKTTAFLLNLTMAVRKGTLLLVVDSPGSYSETAVGSAGGEGKKYPMKWLLDHVMIGKQKKKKAVESEEEVAEVVEEEGEKEIAAWEKVVEDDSRWWRIGESLKYPIALENMRYQIHLYKRV